MSGGSIQALSNEIDTIRCYAGLFRLDAKLVEEFIVLRDFKDQHPLPATQKPSCTSRCKSSLILSIESRLLFGDFCERESRRLAEKLNRLKDGSFSAELAAQGEAERLRNEACAEAAVARELEAASTHPDAVSGGGER